MTEIWLTVVTAVKDDPDGLARTMESLRSQELTGVEVIVVDGSNDRTSAESLYSGIAELHWQAPSGIYAAMNAGLSRARGTFVQFLNAGDCLHDSNVLARVRENLGDTCVWAFGPVELIAEDGQRVVTPYWDFAREKQHLFARGLFPQHQGVFVRRQTLIDLGGFSLSYRIAADYRSFLQLSTIADPVQLDFVVADFHEGGASTVHWQESFQEFHRARRDIFHPRGLSAAREQLATAVHFGRVWIYRTLVLPLRRSARR